MMHLTIADLMAGLAYSADDAAIHAATAQLVALKQATSGDDRAACCWALIECRELLTARGRLHRIAASRARQSTIWVGMASSNVV